jgi:hypothetical protein
MRMLLKVQPDVEKANEALSEGTLQQAIQSTLEELKAEAAYFTALDGKRAALIVFDLQEPSQIPVISEPFFRMNATVELTPVMTAEELQRGLQQAFG